jgi:hypothetical protein
MVTNLPADDYSVTVTDSMGCSMVDMVTVAGFSCASFQPELHVSDITCFGAADGTAAVSLPGGDSLTFVWGDGSTTAAVEGLSAGMLLVTVSDTNGCSATLMGMVNEPAPLNAIANATAETAPGANNGTLSVLVTGGTVGYSFAWSNGFNQSAAFNLIPGQYSITVTDANGCTVVAQATVEAFNCSLAATLDTSPASCPDAADGLALVSSIAGGAWPFAYQWSNGATNFFIDNLLPGTYYVTVSDAIGCTVEASVEIVPDDAVPPSVFAQAVSLSLDSDGSLFLSPDMVDNGSFDNCSQINLEVTPDHFTCADLGPNTITLKATDSSGNTATATTVVHVTDQTPPLLSCPPDTFVMTCDTLFYQIPTAVDACTDVTLSLLSGPPSGSVFPEGETPVSWMAVDAFGNSTACQFTITVDYTLNAGVMVQAPSCAGDSDGMVTLDPSGGEAPYIIQWDDGVDPTALSAGIYFVTIGDAAGCSVSEVVAVTDPPLLLFGLVAITPATPGASDGVVEYVVMGGTPPYSITWLDSNGDVLPDFDSASVAPGAYRTLVTDSVGCTFLSNYFTVEQLSGTASRLMGGAEILVYPNPTRQDVWFDAKDAANMPTDVTLFDPYGRQVNRYDGQAVAMPFLWRLPADLPVGNYLVRLTFGEDAVAWRRLVIAR